MQITLPQLKPNLQVWDKLEILVGDEPNRGRYTTRIEDFIGDDIVLSEPEYIKGGTLLRDKCSIVVIVTRDDAVYQFSAVISRIKGPHGNLYLINMPRRLSRVQRRRFVRVEVLKRVSFTLVDEIKWEDGWEDKAQWHDAVCINVSGGGMLLESSQKIEDEKIILLKAVFFFEVGLPLTIAALCRRTFSENGRFYTGLEFLLPDRLRRYFRTEELNRLPESVHMFDHRTQARLESHVFKEQIELRKKGLL